jgi:hypothetical protein
MNLILVEPMAIAAVSASAGTGAANLATLDPKERWSAASSTNPVTIDIDLGMPRAFDTVGFVDTIYLAGIALDGGAAHDVPLLANTPLGVTGAPPTGRGHFVKRLPAVTVQQHLRVTFTPSGAVPSAGRIIVGRAVETTHDQEYDGGRRPGSTGTAERLRGGGFGIQRGASFATVSWTWGDLSDAELAAIWAVTQGVGGELPLLVAENAEADSYFARGVCYGRFSRFERYNRREGAKSRWAFELEQWV